MIARASLNGFIRAAEYLNDAENDFEDWDEEFEWNEEDHKLVQEVVDTSQMVFI